MSKQKIMQTNHKGFTLIELLVVIAIIGLLATMSVIALGGAREKARDSRRLSDIKQMQTALEMYYTASSSYPSSLSSGDSIAAGGNTYMGEVPSNPEPRNDGECPDSDYHYEGRGNSYVLEYCLAGDSGEVEEDINCATQDGIAVARDGEDIDGYTCGDGL